MLCRNTPRFRTLLLGDLLGTPLRLAMAGIYGVVAYVVGRRLAEIGLPMASGASPGDVLWLVLLGQSLPRACSPACCSRLSQPIRWSSPA